VTRSVFGLSAVLVAWLSGCDTPHSVQAPSAGNGANDNGGGVGGQAGGSGGAAGSWAGSGAGGGTSIADGGFHDPDTGCAVQKQDSRPIPTDIFIMLDKSISMNCPATDANCNNPTTSTPPTRWTAVTDGINNFVTNPANAGIGIGLSLFDYSADGGMCDPQNYVDSATRIVPLPAGGTAVLNRIKATQPGGVTPTLWALKGAILYVHNYMADHPDRTAAVVFVTDGIPNSPLCPSTIQLAAEAAKAAFQETPSIETYVVGMGATRTLDAIALSGSGDAHHYIDANDDADANGDTATKLRDLLKQVSHPITCDYPIPTTTTALNFDAVDVQTRVSGADPTINLKYVPSASACTSTPAWYYDAPPPAIPKKITLCPSACDPLKTIETATVQAVIGCQARIN
jgi:hypothetical protein